MFLSSHFEIYELRNYWKDNHLTFDLKFDLYLECSSLPSCLLHIDIDWSCFLSATYWHWLIMVNISITTFWSPSMAKLSSWHKVLVIGKDLILAHKALGYLIMVNISRRSFHHPSMNGKIITQVYFQSSCNHHLLQWLDKTWHDIIDNMTNVTPK